MAFQLPAVGFKDVSDGIVPNSCWGFSFQQWDLKLVTCKKIFIYTPVSASSSGI